MTSCIQIEICVEVNLTSKLHHISVIIFVDCLSLDLNLATHAQYTHLDVSANTVNKYYIGINSFHQLQSLPSVFVITIINLPLMVMTMTVMTFWALYSRTQRSFRCSVRGIAPFIPDKRLIWWDILKLLANMTHMEWAVKMAMTTKNINLLNNAFEVQKPTKFHKNHSHM